MINEIKLKNQITKKNIFINDNLTSLQKNNFRNRIDDHARHRFKNVLIKIA